MYCPFRRRWDSKCSSECSTNSWMVITGLFSNGSFEKRRELWPSRTLLSIPTSISSLIFYGTGCTMYSLSRNPRWSKFMSLFKWAVWKETCDDHSQFRWAFRRAFRVSSRPCTPYSTCSDISLGYLQSSKPKLVGLFSLKCDKRDVRAFHWSVTKETYDFWLRALLRALEDVTGRGTGCFCDVCKCVVYFIYTA